MRIYSRARSMWVDCIKNFGGYTPMLNVRKNATSFRTDSDIDADVITEFISLLENNSSEDVLLILKQDLK